MPHVKIGYPHRAKDGTKRTQGDIVYLTSAEARAVVADGKGKVVTPTPEEVVELDRGRRKKEEAAKAKAARRKQNAKPAPALRSQAAPEQPKDTDKAKVPARKPSDG